ncbi:hypothetical protein ACO0LF_18250 [Undibacterium sp. Di27W]|uniref:hypothetical protein n=1 Tax=Undibacterium sp. Di27W TaxID=3413036 RepID=UPI003BF14CA7
MSKISISIATPARSLEAVSLIRAVVGLSIDSIFSRLARGKEGVFFCAELFLNDHPEVDKNIRTLLSGLIMLGLEPFIMEISEHEAWGDVQDFNSVRISAVELIGMLDEASGKFL